MKNRFSLQDLQAGETIFLRGGRNNYFLVRGDDAQQKRYRIDAGTDIGHYLCDQAGYTNGLLLVIDVAISGINIGLQPIALKLVFQGYFRKDGKKITDTNTHDGVEAIVDGLLRGNIHGRYLVKRMGPS